jgi:uncharacterized protein YaaN involved in tellurite resistance
MPPKDWKAWLEEKGELLETLTKWKAAALMYRDASNAWEAEAILQRREVKALRETLAKEKAASPEAAWWAAKKTELEEYGAHWQQEAENLLDDMAGIVKQNTKLGAENKALRSQMKKFLAAMPLEPPPQRAAARLFRRRQR